jgi:hypothetical protein
VSGLCGADPAVALPILPLALSLGLVFQVIEDARSVLVVVAPVADVPVAVGEVLRTFAVHLASFELSFVS